MQRSASLIIAAVRPVRWRRVSGQDARLTIVAAWLRAVCNLKKESKNNNKEIKTHTHIHSLKKTSTTEPRASWAEGECKPRKCTHFRISAIAKGQMCQSVHPHANSRRKQEMQLAVLFLLFRSEYRLLIKLTAPSRPTLCLHFFCSIHGFNLSMAVDKKQADM